MTACTNMSVLHSRAKHLDIQKLIVSTCMLTSLLGTVSGMDAAEAGLGVGKARLLALGDLATARGGGVASATAGIAGASAGDGLSSNAALGIAGASVGDGRAAGTGVSASSSTESTPRFKVASTTAAAGGSVSPSPSSSLA